jgi:ABC-2 type transport system permease protein
VTSLFIALGSPRRDHGDRSIEFWLSLPSGHGESLAAPMLVHLLLVPWRHCSWACWPPCPSR